MRATYSDISLACSPSLQHSVAQAHFVFNSPWMNCSPINMSSCFSSVRKLLTSRISCDNNFHSLTMCYVFLNWHLIILFDILKYLWEMMNIIFSHLLEVRKFNNICSQLSLSINTPWLGQVFVQCLETDTAFYKR